MGVDTKGFVVTKKETMLDLMPKLIQDINKWQRDLLDKEIERTGAKNRFSFLLQDVNKKWSNGIWNINTYDFKSFNLYFRINGERRSLFITHNCSSDYKDVDEGVKISFSLGCWGMSEEIMSIVCESVKGFGDTYYCANDCQYDFSKFISYDNGGLKLNDYSNKNTNND